MSSTIRQTAFRFTEEDLELLDTAKKHAGTATRTDALRVVLRYYVRTEGLTIGKPGAKARAKAKR